MSEHSSNISSVVYSNGSDTYTPSTGSHTAGLTTTTGSEVHMITYDSDDNDILMTHSIASDIDKSTPSLSSTNTSIQDEDESDSLYYNSSLKTRPTATITTYSQEEDSSSLCSANISATQYTSSNSDISAQTTGTETTEEEDSSEEEEDEDGTSTEEEGSTISDDTTSTQSHDHTSCDLQQKRHDMQHSNIFLTETLNLTTPTTQSSLLQGVQNGDLNIVRRSLAQRVLNVTTSCDQYKRSMLHIACSFGHYEIVKLLLAANHPVDAISIKKQTPLMEACIGGHFKIVQLLVPEVDDLDHVDDEGRSAAHYCALNGEVKCLNVLCDHGSDICLEDNMSRSCIHYAAMKDHSDIIQCLIERGAELESVDNEGQTPGHYAARHNSLSCLGLLVSCAAELTQGDNTGTQPIHLAAYNDKLDSVKLLLKKGRAKCSDIDHKGRNILHKACQGNAVDCLHWLLTTGRLGPNTTDSLGNTGLHLSAVKGHQETYYCLLQHGANDLYQNNEGLTPLDVAKRNGKTLYIQKAIEGKKKCPHCFKESDYKEKPYQTKLNKKLEAKQETLFKTTKTTITTPTNTSLRKTDVSNLTNVKTSHKKPAANGDKMAPQKVSLTQILATKYYGPPAF